MYLHPHLDVMGKRPVWLEYFPTCIRNFDMGEMGSGTRNTKIFWRRHDICMFFLLSGGSSALCRDDPWLCG